MRFTTRKENLNNIGKQTEDDMKHEKSIPGDLYAPCEISRHTPNLVGV